MKKVRIAVPPRPVQAKTIAGNQHARLSRWGSEILTDEPDRTDAHGSSDIDVAYPISSRMHYDLATVGIAQSRSPARLRFARSNGHGWSSPVQGAGLVGEAPEEVHAAAAHGISGTGTRLPYLDRIQQSFGPRHDLSTVHAHLDNAATESTSSMEALAYTRGEHVAFGTPPDLRLAAHEAAHVVQQRAGVRLQNNLGAAGDHYERGADAVADRVASGQMATDLLTSPAGSIGAGNSVQHAVPVAVIWGAKAVAATTFDAFIDFAIAAILGLPTPGALDHVGNFLVNLVPFLGEAKKVKKIKKVLKLVGDLVGPIKKMKDLKVPGSSKLVDNLLREARKLEDEMNALNLDGARRTFGVLLGYVREAQVATKLQSKGMKIEHLGKTIKQNKQILTDIDIVSREGKQLVLTQVKAGNAAMLTPGSTSWKAFTRQATRTKEAAKALHDETGVATKVRYVIDDITPDARSYLEGLGFTVEMSGTFLK